MISIGFVGFDKRKKVIDIFKHIVNKFSKEEIIIKEISAENIEQKDLDLENCNIIVFETNFFEKCINKIINFTNLSPKAILIVNYDDKSFFQILRGEFCRLITYGLNNKSCITASSIQDGGEYICCIQRSFFDFFEKLIEPHEFIVVLKKYKVKNIYTVLILASVVLMCGIDCFLEDKIVL